MEVQDKGVNDDKGEHDDDYHQRCAKVRSKVIRVMFYHTTYRALNSDLC